MGLGGLGLGLSQEAEQVGSPQHLTPFPPSCITGLELEPDGGDGGSLVASDLTKDPLYPPPAPPPAPGPDQLG